MRNTLYDKDLKPALYIVATPIGNSFDISPRAKEVLTNVDLVACEDTRVTGKLFERLELTPPKLISYHDKNESQRAEEILEKMLSDNLNVAIVSDAGTPCVSDPGYRIAALAHEKNIKVIPVPGASAVITLAMASGLPTDRFCFIGFLPHKKEARKSEVEGWNKSFGSVIFYEAATRIEDSLKIISSIWPKAKIAIGRELTKTFEEIVQFSAQESMSWIAEKNKSHSLKGEFVVMCSGFESVLSEEDLVSRITKEAEKGFLEGKSHKKLLKEMAHYNFERSKLYDLLLDIKKSLK